MGLKFSSIHTIHTAGRKLLLCLNLVSWGQECWRKLAQEKPVGPEAALLDAYAGH